MEVIGNNYIPGDSRLIDQIVYELKSQGIFDQFRKECIADVDTKPAYQNLRQRVEGSVTGFLKKQMWRPDMNKNHVREMLRKNIHESGFLETGVERIVDQVVNPKINSVFLPQVEDVVYRFLGIEKPNRNEGKDVTRQLRINILENLLPTDLEAVSPESETNDMIFDENMDIPDASESKMEEDESPPFEPLEEQISYVPHEENSVDSHLSGFSGLASHDSNHSHDAKSLQMDISNQDSQQSKPSSDEQFSNIVSDDNETKMEICEDSRLSKSSKSMDSNTKFELTQDSQTNSEKSFNSAKPDKKTETAKSKDKKSDKSRSSSKHTSRRDSKSDRKEDRDRKSDSKDKKEHKDRHSSLKDSSRTGDKSRDRKDSRSSSSKHESKSTKDKEKTSTKDKEIKSDKDKNEKSKEKEKSDKDKSKVRHSSSSRDRNGSRKDSHSKEKSTENRDKSKSSSSREHKDSKSKEKGDEKYKSDKSKKDEKHRSHSSSQSKEKKDVKKESKKDLKDDHFSSKMKKHERRSTDRDSNDGQSNVKASSNSLNSSTVSHSQKSQDSSTSNSGTGSADSGNSDHAETDAATNEVTENIEMLEQNVEMHQMIKIIKPKFASNIHEAKRLMKIRKRLDKLEKKKQLALDLATHSMNVKESETLGVYRNGLIDAMNLENEICKKRPNILKKRSSFEVLKLDIPKPTIEEKSKSPELISPPLQNSIISKETWDALEAKLNETVLNTDYGSYEECNNEEVVVCEPAQLEAEEVKVEPTKEECVVETKEEGDKQCEVNDEMREAVALPENAPEELQEEINTENVAKDLNKPHKNNGSLEETETKQPVQEIPKISEFESANDESQVESAHVVSSCNRASFCEDSRCPDNCICFERSLLPESQRYLKFAADEIKKLEESISDLSSKVSSNVVMNRKRNVKRKIPDASSDVKNNNKRVNNQRMTRKPVKSLPTVVVQNDMFPLPLSPAESEKSIDRKVEVTAVNKRTLTPTKSASAKTAQRYSSDDLYKPRPLITGSRRRAGRNPKLD